MRWGSSAAHRRYRSARARRRVLGTPESAPARGDRREEAEQTAPGGHHERTTRNHRTTPCSRTRPCSGAAVPQSDDGDSPFASTSPSLCLAALLGLASAGSFGTGPRASGARWYSSGSMRCCAARTRGCCPPTAPRPYRRGNGAGERGDAGSVFMGFSFTPNRVPQARWRTPRSNREETGCRPGETLYAAFASPRSRPAAHQRRTPFRRAAGVPSRP